MSQSAVGLGAIGVGSIFLYAGIKGYSVPQAIQNLISGKPPATSQSTVSLVTNPVPLAPGQGGIVGSGGSAIANDALRYKGAGYVWGGAPAKGIGNWDCSSFCNWVIGHDEQMAIPGYAAGKYDGSSHGPPTTVWLVWNGCTTIGHDPNSAQAGDLCVWQTHMGIALGPNSMISAQDPALGTNVSNIALPGELLFVRRLNA